MKDKTTKLGNSVFNYKSYDEYRFIHYYQQINHILKLNPKSVLEIGPGDYTVTDFLRRKGIKVKTFDNDKLLNPDYIGDIRNINIKEKFDLVLLSEVLEHVKFEYFEKIVRKLSEISKKWVVISLPYPHIRLFGKSDAGTISLICCKSSDGTISSGLYFCAFAWTSEIYCVGSFFLNPP